MSPLDVQLDKVMAEKCKMIDNLSHIGLVLQTHTSTKSQLSGTVCNTFSGNI